jgi:hypothetical protein
MDQRELRVAGKDAESAVTASIAFDGMHSLAPNTKPRESA